MSAATEYAKTLSKLKHRLAELQAEMAQVERAIDALSPMVGKQATDRNPGNRTGRAEAIRQALKAQKQPIGPASLAKYMTQKGYHWGPGIDPTTEVTNELSRMHNSRYSPVKRVKPGFYEYDESKAVNGQKGNGL